MNLEKLAWEKFESGSHHESVCLWIKIIRTAASKAEKNRCLSNLGYPLVGMKKFIIAKIIYEKLFADTADHRYLHQLGTVYKSDQKYTEALEIFEKERSIIINEDAKAINAYELADIYIKLRNLQKAEYYSSLCKKLSNNSLDKILQACAHIIRAEYHQYCGEKNLALKNYNDSKKYFKIAGDTVGVKEIEKLIYTLSHQ